MYSIYIIYIFYLYVNCIVYSIHHRVTLRRLNPFFSVFFFDATFFFELCTIIKFLEMHFVSTPKKVLRNRPPRPVRPRGNDLREPTLRYNVIHALRALARLHGGGGRRDARRVLFALTLWKSRFVNFRTFLGLRGRHRFQSRQPFFSRRARHRSPSWSTIRRQTLWSPSTVSERNVHAV